MRRMIVAGLVVVLVATGVLTYRAFAAGAPLAQRVIVKVCGWDGVVPGRALDGFKMPGGKWADFQRQGYKVESYIVAPDETGKKKGFYAVLAK